MNSHSYAGIGARDTPPLVLSKMIEVGKLAAELGWTLRSGGANGADSAFEQGCDLADGKKEIYLPWDGFNGRSSGYFTQGYMAKEIAKQFHPRWSNLNQAHKKMMARNTHQVLGPDCTTHDNVIDVVVCYTKNGDMVGGTSQALRICNDMCVPIINLGSLEICTMGPCDILDLMYKAAKTTAPKEGESYDY